MLADIVKIHCLKHHADFPMSRTSRIVVCREGPEEHILSDDFPYSGSWLYCCNCQSFITWEISSGEVSIKQCPFCLSSLNPRLYTCDHCAVTMLDFDDPTLRKYHSVLSWGMPQPACPACHQLPGSTPKIHFCQVLQSDLATARSACPFCHLQTGEIVVDGASAITAELDSALADAEFRARESEERRRLAEEAAREEMALRARAERWAGEIDTTATGQSALPQTGSTEAAKQEVEAALARAESEARARAVAEQLAYAATLEREEAERRKAEAEARAREAEERAWEMSQRLTSDLTQPQTNVETITRRDKVTIALYSGIATALFFALILILYSLFRSLQ